MLWKKQNGIEIEINDDPANVEAAEKLGWIQVGEGEQSETPVVSPTLPDLKPDSFASNPATSGAITLGK